MMHRYSVGRPYNPAVRSWPEAPQFNLRGGQAELVLFLHRPTDAEVRAVEKSPAGFALFAEHDQIILCYRFGPRLPWSDAPFTIHRVPAAERVVPDPAGLGPETRALLAVILVDAADGVIRAMRQVSFSPEFTRALYAAVRHQAGVSFLAEEYDAALAQIYRRYPTSERLAAACSIRTEGGD